MTGLFFFFTENVVHMFSSIVGPLTNLYHKTINLEWINNCDISFLQYKISPYKYPVLSVPDVFWEAKLIVDSGVGVGAALLQEQSDHVDRDVSFFFK